MWLKCRFLAFYQIVFLYIFVFSM
uniref:Uncharacterized protein n=1 Tax=Anguilla anguilla TaxID=7936 RepID=A0A0E9TFK1_ANGAN